MNGLVFGIDLGIASCGWAVIRYPIHKDDNGKIVDLGSWLFDVPETDKERTPTNQIRRGNRLLRRVIRRRAQRMGEIRRLFHDHHLLTERGADALKHIGHDPWELRARGLDKPLKPSEFAVALGHIAKRRGFKSAAKRKEVNTVGDEQKMLKALESTKEKLGRFRTIGEMFARDSDYTSRKRNREGIFDRTQSRDDLSYEVAQIFMAQRRLGNSKASEELEQAFLQIAFRQKELQDSERLVGMCPFEPAEKRASKFAPSYERFRLLTKLLNLRIVTEHGERPLSDTEIAAATVDLGKTAKLSVKEVRKRISLPSNQRFSMFKPDEEDRDIVARTGEALHGTRKLRNVLGEELWCELQQKPEQLDTIAQILSFFETQSKILEELRKHAVPVATREAIAAGLEAGAFSQFKGAGHISSKAARKLIPWLEIGLRYDQACEKVGYNHAASRWSEREQITDKASFNRLVQDMGEKIANPIARKSLTEGLKQLWAMRNHWGLPDAIHIEMARDVGNSLEERIKIKKRLDDTTAQRVRERKEVQELLGIEIINSDTLLRYRLWKEQNEECPYTGKKISPSAIIATDNAVQVDHILPWSRFGDDSYNNKVLCTSAANQEKKGQTPFEWLSKKGDDAWNYFVARIESNPQLRGSKKRNFVLKNAEDAAERFRSRNLNDTRYAAKLLADAAKLFYPEGERQEKHGIRRVYTRPGALTSALRQAWGVESLKKIDGKRVDDARHHALDALVIAAIGEGEVQRLTRSYQEWEKRGLGRSLRQVAPPWGDANSFRRDVKQAYDGIFVARAERRRARGEGHAATIRQLRDVDGTAVIFERKPIGKLVEKDLDRIKDPERNQGIVDALRQWIKAGSPLDHPPHAPSGHVITKVRLATTGKKAVSVRGGSADRGKMLRVDVFTKPNKRGKDEFYLIPIYPHQVMNKRAWPHPPMHAVVAHKDEADWTLIDESFAFRFSLFPRCYVEVIKPTGEVLAGYFNGMNRSLGSITLSNHRDYRSYIDDNNNSTIDIGAKTLLTIKKYNVDRFGSRNEVKAEVRTWHGVACISPNPRG